MRMETATHHAVAILTLRELKRHRRGVRAIRAVQYRDSRCEGNEVPPPRVLPWSFTRTAIQIR